MKTPKKPSGWMNPSDLIRRRQAEIIRLRVEDGFLADPDDDDWRDAFETSLLEYISSVDKRVRETKRGLQRG